MSAVSAAGDAPAGPERYPKSGNSTNGSQALTAGFAANSAPSAPLELFELSGHRGAVLQFGGAGANNTTFDAHVWTFRRTYGTDGLVSGIVKQYFGKAAVILGAVDAPGGIAASNAERGADTITWTPSSTATTPKGVCAVVEAVFLAGASAAYSPANDTLAELPISQFGRVDGLLVEFVMGTATSGFAMIQRTGRK